MQIRRSERQTSVFVLQWEDVERLVNALSESLPSISIEAKCSDGLTRQFKDVSELKGYSNSQRGAIEILSLVARSDDFRHRFAVSFGRDFKNNVTMSIDADEDVALRANSFYFDFMDSVRPWYSWIARTDWYVVLFAILGLTLATLVAFTAVTGQFSKLSWASFVEHVSSGESTASFFHGVLIAFAALSLNSIRSRFFPTGVFAFGDGAKRHSAGETLRTVVIVGFAISIISSVAMTVLY